METWKLIARITVVFNTSDTSAAPVLLEFTQEKTGFPGNPSAVVSYLKKLHVIAYFLK